ncbi:GNAT family N-acetyltransferase [Cryobacterium sp. PH31-L1]|uniref:GNAT family N-acetyltransferase n=1 Tax=Cryobacterium sp. PH31-L1 TaxID=3046199 RepID=UPI0024BA3EE9|nr:GNAT family N-acetyltransferase [Cryobacterium sp. PH31-L1]MDJ0377961.1 GNAT family N-acetyltransferase [Cryobacterium sp. PH31-L1]
MIDPPAPWHPQYPIRTSRLLLRPHRADDLDDLAVFHGDPEVTRYIPWPVRDREQTEAALRLKLAQGVVLEVGQWLVLAIEEAASALVIGEVLLKNGDDHRAEIGYVLRADRQGRGLATEAVRAMLDLAVNILQVTTIDATVVDGNAASRRLLERLGFLRLTSLDHPNAGATVLGYRFTLPASTPLGDTRIP